jgi:hypothetical protein
MNGGVEQSAYEPNISGSNPATEPIERNGERRVQIIR